MICAEYAAGSAPPYVIQASASQPLDVSTCELVLLEGTDAGALSIFGMPSGADLGQIWSIGFSGVVLCYLLAWGVGTVVNFVRTR